MEWLLDDDMQYNIFLSLNSTMHQSYLLGSGFPKKYGRGCSSTFSFTLTLPETNIPSLLYLNINFSWSQHLFHIHKSLIQCHAASVPSSVRKLKAVQSSHTFLDQLSNWVSFSHKKHHKRQTTSTQPPLSHPMITTNTRLLCTTRSGKHFIQTDPASALWVTDVICCESTLTNRILLARSRNILFLSLLW